MLLLQIVAGTYSVVEASKPEVEHVVVAVAADGVP